MDLLEAIAEWQSSGEAAPMDLHFFEPSAAACAFAKLARKEEGIDKQ